MQNADGETASRPESASKKKKPKKKAPPKKKSSKPPAPRAHIAYIKGPIGEGLRAGEETLHVYFGEGPGSKELTLMELVDRICRHDVRSARLVFRGQVPSYVDALVVALKQEKLFLHVDTDGLNPFIAIRQADHVTISPAGLQVPVLVIADELIVRDLEIDTPTDEDEANFPRAALNRLVLLERLVKAKRYSVVPTEDVDVLELRELLDVKNTGPVKWEIEGDVKVEEQ